MQNRFVIFFGIVVSWLLMEFCQPVVGQMTIADYSVARNDRFVNDRGGVEFLGDSLQIDLSGVGRVNEGAGRWVTMISPTHFLSAAHAAPSSGTVTFYQGNDLTSPTIECTIDPDRGRAIGETDFWLGRLDVDSCDTDELLYYSLANPGNYVGQIGVGIGRSDRTPGARSTSLRVGQNRVSYVESGEYFRGVSDHVVFADDSVDGDVENIPAQSTPSQLESEFRVANGDSGAPTFVRSITGDYELLGIHTYLGYDGQPGESRFDASRWASIDIYVPTDRNAIYDQVRLDDTEFTFVRNLDNQPVGNAVGQDFYVIQSGFDCDLDNVISASDLNCTQWAGSLTTLEFMLDRLGAPLGDTNLDGKVGFEEFLVVSRNFGGAGQYTDGDYTLDGIVDFADFLILAQNFGVDVTRETAETVTVPEPKRCSLVFFVILCIRRWIRKIPR